MIPFGHDRGGPNSASLPDAQEFTGLTHPNGSLVIPSSLMQVRSRRPSRGLNRAT